MINKPLVVLFIVLSAIVLSEARALKAHTTFTPVDKASEEFKTVDDFARQGFPTQLTNATTVQAYVQRFADLTFALTYVNGADRYDLNVIKSAKGNLSAGRLRKYA